MRVYYGMFVLLRLTCSQGLARRYRVRRKRSCYRTERAVVIVPVAETWCSGRKSWIVRSIRRRPVMYSATVTKAIGFYAVGSRTAMVSISNNKLLWPAGLIDTSGYSVAKYVETWVKRYGGYSPVLWRSTFARAIRVHCGLWPPC